LSRGVTSLTADGAVLNRRILYMLPTRYGLFFAVVLFAMLLAAVNYNNGLAHAFTFMLGAMMLISMLYTHRNLSGITVHLSAGPPVFAGEIARFPLRLLHDGRVARPSIWIMAGDFREPVDVPAGDFGHVDVAVATERRGYVTPPVLRIATAYPFGLLYTWTGPLRASARGLVYPAPGPRVPLPEMPDRRRHQQPGQQPDGDDFMGLRPYHPGDPPRHVHWKATARGQGMLTKRFGGAGAGTLWLDFDTTPGRNTEARLSQLCRWILDAEEQGAFYGLRLPGLSIEPDNGAPHKHACLSALARFRMPHV